MVGRRRRRRRRREQQSRVGRRQLAQWRRRRVRPARVVVAVGWSRCGGGERLGVRGRREAVVVVRREGGRGVVPWRRRVERTGRRRGGGGGGGGRGGGGGAVAGGGGGGPGSGGAREEGEGGGERVDLRSHLSPQALDRPLQRGEPPAAEREPALLVRRALPKAAGGRGGARLGRGELRQLQLELGGTRRADAARGDACRRRRHAGVRCRSAA